MTRTLPEIHRFTVNPFQENSYLITLGETAVLVDPGFSNAMEWETCRAFLETRGLTLQAVLLTHAHLDHIMGVHRIQTLYPGLPVYMHPEAMPDWDRSPLAAAYYGIPFETPLERPVFFPDAHQIAVNDLQIEIRNTPGHARGHVVLRPAGLDEVLSGDTLFYRSIGRTDLPGGNQALLETSIREQLYSLPPRTVLHPGHGPATTVQDEMRSNPYVRPA